MGAGPLLARPPWPRQQQGEQPPQQQQQDPREAIDRGVSLVLLFGAAVDRLATRLQTAVLATGRVTWQLGREGLVGLFAAARRASGTARTNLASRWVLCDFAAAAQPACCAAYDRRLPLDCHFLCALTGVPLPICRPR